MRACRCDGEPGVLRRRGEQVPGAEPDEHGHRHERLLHRDGVRRGHVRPPQLQAVPPLLADGALRRALHPVQPQAGAHPREGPRGHGAQGRARHLPPQDCAHVRAGHRRQVPAVLM
ncbi:Pistil-specific extensin-like protein [Zea mays]|uniref:Pistil-specific extensin-like protein n=1 Tax=Zea mays TaxID=4577 RepID=A0A1D6MA72_MAIZE|nr:Pistil-specific extensin-like protein [Zea mays]